MAKKIILAEDSPLQRETFRAAIKSRAPEPIEIDEVGDGKELVERVRQHDYLLVITDYQMPKMDGLEAARRIREFNRRIPICVMSDTNLEKQVSQLEGIRYVNKDGFGGIIEPILREYLS